MLRLLIYEVPGTHLLSHGVAPTLPSAQDGLTTGFGMVPGVSRPSICTRDKIFFLVPKNCIGTGFYLIPDEVKASDH